MDSQFERAMEAGQKNQQTVTLIQNWCSHARVEKYGGTGLVEQMTGLPIGHHSVACDYASPGNTVATWDLADAAIGFYDRNCVGCGHRNAVRLPNLTVLIAERDAAARTHAAEAAADALKGEAALKDRRAGRAVLRAQLPPASQSLVDHLEALDVDPGGKAGEELVAVAGLVPEAFTPALVEFLFGLIERNEHWASETALVVLNTLNASPARLANGALRSLARYGGLPSAEVLLANIDQASAHLVGPAVPMLIQHAEPARVPFVGPGAAPNPRFLVAVHRAFPAEVEKTVEGFLESKDQERLSDGARAVCVLGDADGATALKFARTVISKLVRTAWSDGTERSPARGELRRAAALAYGFDPEAAEMLITNFRAGASDQATNELCMIYRWVLRRGFRNDGPPFDAGERAAFDRMISLAASPPNKDVERELGGFFTHGCYSYKALVAEKLDALLGAAALLADALDRLDARYKATTAQGFLEGLERNARRSGLAHLQNALTERAAEAAAGDAARTRQFLDTLASIPSERTELRRALVKHLDQLITSPETLSAVLPSLYAALVGASTLERGAAARTIGKMRHRLLEDAPPLLLEAFVALLGDRFLYPISAVVKALDHIRLPDSFRQTVRAQLGAIITAYATTTEHQSLLVQAIDTLASNFLLPEELNGQTGDRLIQILEAHELHHYYSDLRSFAFRFREQPAFGRLVIKSLEDPSYRDLDDVREMLGDLPAATVAANATAFETFAQGLSLEGHDWVISQILVENFTRSDLWDRALGLIDAMSSRLSDVPRNRSRRLHLETLRAAVEVEHAVAQGRLQDIAALGETWREAAARDEEERARAETS